MRNLSQIFAAVFILTLLKVGAASANSNAASPEQEKKFSVRLSADNYFGYSQETSTDVFLSIANGYAYVNDKYQLHDNIGTRMANIALVYHLMVLNHEFGHAMRIKEVGYKLTGITVKLFGGYASYRSPLSGLKYQEKALISLGGVQADYFLSQKIINQSLNRNQAMDPISSTLYFGTALDQSIYSSFWSYKLAGHDIKMYINNMERMYGKGSITKSKIQAIAWMDFLDPLAYTSAYSFLLNEDMDLPMLPVGNWPGLGDVAVMPAAKLALTPYGVLEKRLVLYAKTDYSPIKLVFGFGRENKTNTPIVDRKSASYIDGFTAPDSVAPKKHNTYYFELAVNKAASYESLNLGIAVAAWRQPKLLTKDPRHAKIKNGGMVTLKAEHQLNENNSIFADLGYKTQGFVMGQPLAKSPFVRVGFNWNL